MRHVIGFVLGLVLVPAVVVVPGWALPRLTYIAGFGGDFISRTGLITVGPLVVLAVLLGVCVAVRRVSALASLLPALALTGGTGVYVVAPELALGLLPGTEWGQGVSQLLMLGAYLPLGLLLLVPMFMPSRWRGTTEEEDDFTDLTDDGEDELPELPRRRPRHAAPDSDLDDLGELGELGEEEPDLGYRGSRRAQPSHRR